MSCWYFNNFLYFFELLLGSGFSLLHPNLQGSLYTSLFQLSLLSTFSVSGHRTCFTRYSVLLVDQQSVVYTAPVIHTYISAGVSVLEFPRIHTKACHIPTTIYQSNSVTICLKYPYPATCYIIVLCLHLLNENT